MSISLNPTGEQPVDFREPDVALKSRPLRRAPLHPGAIAAGILEDERISVRAAATAIGTTNTNLDKILKGTRPITPEMAVRFGVYFRNGPELWLKMQADFDIYHARHALEGALRSIKPIGFVPEIDPRRR